MKISKFDQINTLEDFLEYAIKFEIVETSVDSGIHEIERFNHLIELGKQVDSVLELGVFQGRTLAAFMLQNPSKVTGVDINLDKFDLHHKSLFETYARKNNIEFELIEESSISSNSIRNVDLLHIDSLHEPTHLQKELDLHAEHVSKFITFHDTKLANGRADEFRLWKIVEQFLENNKEWELYEHYTLGKCGHATIKKKEIK